MVYGRENVAAAMAEGGGRQGGWGFPHQGKVVEVFLRQGG
jgi:hypothetical protein